MRKLVIIFILLSSCFLKGTKNYTKIKFEILEKNLDNIEYKSNGEFYFKFFNVGENPLHIESVDLSCSCLGGEWPKEEINPNDSAYIKIHRDTGRIGEFREMIRVHYNGKDSPVTVSLSGNVIYDHTN